ncbi:MAG: ABC transporter substrate-binding protein [Burkholderiaceae bacterium]
MDGKPIRTRFSMRAAIAVGKAINRPAIVEQVMEGQAIPAGQVLPKGFFGVSEKLRPVDYDPAGAKKMLADASYPDRLADDHPRAERSLHQRCRNRRGGGPDADPHRHHTGSKPCRARCSSSARPQAAKTRSRSSRCTPPAAGCGLGKASSLRCAHLIATYDKTKRHGQRQSRPALEPRDRRAGPTGMATVDDDKRAVLLAKATEMSIESGAIIPRCTIGSYWAMRETDCRTRAANGRAGQYAQRQLMTGRRTRP